MGKGFNIKKLIVGIGNPGRKYQDTRHNLGFKVVEKTAETLGLKLNKPLGTLWKFGKCRWVQGVLNNEGFMLMEPLTYMNLSGIAVSKALAQTGVPPDMLFVICDDINLPLGKIRIRPKGSDGGHNGLKSIIQCVGTKDFPRLRLGIGMPAQGDVVDHVLGRFNDDELPKVQEMIEKAKEAVIGFIEGKNLNDLMNKFNG